MTTDRGDVLGSDAGRTLVGELAQAMLQRAAPDELPLYEETAADYFHDPQAVLTGKSRDEAVGFGLEIALITPSVFAVATEAARFLATLATDTARDELREELRPVIASKVKRLLGRDEEPAAGDHEQATGGRTPGPSLTAEQLRQVRQIALQRATQSGLDEDKAASLADALVGALIADS